MTSDLTTEDTENTEGFCFPANCAIIVDGEAVDRLVFTSVDDLRSKIKLSEKMGSRPCLATLQVARQMCLDHGYKTKAKILADAIQRQEGAK